MIRFEQVTKSFGAQPILNGVDLTFPKGDQVRENQ